MKTSQRYRAVLLCALLFALLGVSACTALITPNVKTELVALKEGQYKLDLKHTAVLL